MTTHAVVVAARNLLHHEGWIQGQGHIDGGGYCAVGALNMAEHGHWRRHCSREVEKAVVSGIGMTGMTYLPGWNDVPSRTKEEVLALFDKAILATAPPPPDPSWSDLTEEVEAIHA